MADTQRFDIHVVVDTEAQPELMLALQLVRLLAGEEAVTRVGAPLHDAPLVGLEAYVGSGNRAPAEAEYLTLVRKRERQYPAPFVTKEDLRRFLRGLHPGNSGRIGQATNRLWRVYCRGSNNRGANVLEYVITCATCGVTVTGAVCEATQYRTAVHDVVSVSSRSIIEQHPALLKRTGLPGIGPGYKADAGAFTQHLVEQMGGTS